MVGFTGFQSPVFAHGDGGGGEGGEGADELSQQLNIPTLSSMTMVNKDHEAYDEALQYYLDSMQQRDDELRPSRSDGDRDLDRIQGNFDKAELQKDSAEFSEFLGDSVWGGTFQDLSGALTFVAWHVPLNATRTFFYGMLLGHNETVYNLNQQSTSGKVINRLIAEGGENYRGREILSDQGQNNYYVVGDAHEVPRSE